MIQIQLRRNMTHMSKKRAVYLHTIASGEIKRLQRFRKRNVYAILMLNELLHECESVFK
jgi:hypothetical protein